MSRGICRGTILLVMKINHTSLLGESERKKHDKVEEGNLILFCDSCVSLLEITNRLQGILSFKKGRLILRNNN